MGHDGFGGCLGRPTQIPRVTRAPQIAVVTRLQRSNGTESIATDRRSKGIRVFGPWWGLP